MKINFNTAQTFKGYSNVIVDDIIGENYRLSYMIMKVDNDGSPDLDKLREIKHAMAREIKQPMDLNEDTFFFSSACTQNGRSLSFENMALLYGKDMETIKDAVNKGYKLSPEFLETEKLHLKIYAFIENLTRRIMNDNNPIYSNEGLRDTRLKLLTEFSKISGEVRTAYFFLNRSMNTNVPIQELAGKFNKLIRKTMKHYFA